MVSSKHGLPLVTVQTSLIRTGLQACSHTLKKQVRNLPENFFGPDQELNKVVKLWIWISLKMCIAVCEIYRGTPPIGAIYRQNLLFGYPDATRNLCLATGLAWCVGVHGPFRWTRQDFCLESSFKIFTCNTGGKEKVGLYVLILPTFLTFHPPGNKKQRNESLYLLILFFSTSISSVIVSFQLCNVKNT